MRSLDPLQVIYKRVIVRRCDLRGDGTRGATGSAGPILLRSFKLRGGAEGGTRELFAGLARGEVRDAELSDGVGG